MLILSAMFVLAACGSKSSSSSQEASNEAEEAETANVEFADPAIVSGDGVDLTSYFTAESLSQPSIYEDNSGDFHYSINIKLKLAKKLNLKQRKDDAWSPEIDFRVNFCDKSGTKIASGVIYKFEDRDNLSEMEVGRIVNLDIISDEKDGFPQSFEENIKKIEKIEVVIGTEHAELIKES